MFLEERVERLEQAATDQARQTEVIAKGLANLTVDVRAIRQDINSGFERIDRRFAAVDREIAELKADVAELKADVASLKAEVAQINKRLDEFQLTQQLILQLLTERLK